MNRHASRTVAVWLTGLAVAGMSGCLRVAPKMSKPLASMAPIGYSAGALDADVKSYHAALAGGQLEVAKTDRNQIVFRIMAQIDAAYGEFELKLSTQRAGAQTSGDAAQLGLTAAATVVGASGVKDILTATATALQGTRLSFDKNFFEQKTTEALVSQMRATRKNLQAQMLLSLANRDVASYPLEAAWIDVVNYYYAGTIPSALVDIASKAGSEAVTADGNLKNVVKTLTPATPVQAKNAVSNRQVYAQLQKAIASGDDAQIKAAAATLEKILGGAKIAFDATAAPAVLLEDFRQAIVATADDDAKLDTLSAAVQAATQH